MAQASTIPWSSGLCDAFRPLDRFCMAFWCPCVVFGKTKERLRDPSLSKYEGAYNADCFNYFCTGCMVEAPMRQEMRERWGLEGDTKLFNSDLCLTMCCPACTLVQEEKEVIYRTSGAQSKGYVAQPPMQAPIQMDAQHQGQYR